MSEKRNEQNEIDIKTKVLEDKFFKAIEAYGHTAVLEHGEYNKEWEELWDVFMDTFRFKSELEARVEFRHFIYDLVGEGLSDGWLVDVEKEEIRKEANQQSIERMRSKSDESDMDDDLGEVEIPRWKKRINKMNNRIDFERSEFHPDGRTKAISINELRKPDPALQRVNQKIVDMRKNIKKTDAESNKADVQSDSGKSEEKGILGRGLDLLKSLTGRKGGKHATS